ncbi:MAG TPA: cardiolipin synthase, partial [Syntrophomonas sp.]|nr:cardiolipin synthase [Syntrophomonas sp.]
MQTDIMVRILEIIYFLNVVFAILLIFFERRSSSTTLTWLLLLLFIPVLGFIMYIFLGQDLRKKKIFFLKKEEEHKIFPLLRRQDELIHADRLALRNQRFNQYRDLIHLHLNTNQSFFSQDNQLEVFVDGELLFEDLLASLKKAQKFIHLQSYIIRNDQLGRRVLHLLTEKARQGVEVRLLYDGMGCIRLPRHFFRPLIEAGGRVSSFFPPFLPFINLRINYRNHRKICVIDGRQAYVGGFNIGDEYLGLSKFGYWRDTHVKIEGSAVVGLAFRFLLDWRFAAQDYAPIDEKYFPNDYSAGQTGVQIVSSGPDSHWTSIKD